MDEEEKNGKKFNSMIRENWKEIFFPWGSWVVVNGHEINLNWSERDELLKLFTVNYLLVELSI